MRLNLRNESDVSYQGNQEHVARAFAEADRARMEYLNKRIAETQDDDDDIDRGGDPYRGKPKPPPHVKPSGPHGRCIVCHRKTGPCFALDSPYRKENQNVAK